MGSIRQGLRRLASMLGNEILFIQDKRPKRVCFIVKKIQLDDPPATLLGLLKIAIFITKTHELAGFWNLL